MKTPIATETIVLIGNGAREHALAVALSQSAAVKEIIVCPGNGGTQSEGGKISNAVDNVGNPILKQDNGTVLELVKRVNPDMVVIGPAQPLVNGVVDALAEECPRVKVFGPSKAGAGLEASKVSPGWITFLFTLGMCICFFSPFPYPYNYKQRVFHYRLS